MNKKTKRARDFLEELKEIDTRIQNAKFDQEYWEAYSLGLSSQSESVMIGGELHNVEKVQSTPNPHRMEDAIIASIEKKPAANIKVEELLKRKEMMLDVISKLKTPSYDILHKIYVQKITLTDYAEQKDRSKSWADSQHGIAIKNLQELLERENQDEKNE